MDPNSVRLPHRNLNNFDTYALPLNEDQKQQPSSSAFFSNLQMYNSEYTGPNQSIKPYQELQGPMQIQYQHDDDYEKQKQLYWTQRQQNWITLSYNMNPLAFASAQLFKSGNLSLTESSNPLACVLVFVIKILILVCYFIYPYLGLKDKVILFRSVILLAALDFWVVKNVCGRILVGLRWWVEIDEDGNERWVFETKLQKLNTVTQRIHNRIFWFTQVFMAMMFTGMFIMNLFTLQVDISISMALPAFLTGFNLWAFNMCNKVKKSRMGEYMLAITGGQNKQSLKLPLQVE